jgi:hypothetical protein
VYATDAELSPPGSQATSPPTATTAPTATGTTRRPPRALGMLTMLGMRQIRLNAPMEGSLPPVRGSR